jgi:hypothetical protein
MQTDLFSLEWLGPHPHRVGFFLFVPYLKEPLDGNAGWCVVSLL